MRDLRIQFLFLTLILIYSQVQVPYRILKFYDLNFIGRFYLFNIFLLFLGIRFWSHWRWCSWCLCCRHHSTWRLGRNLLWWAGTALWWLCRPSVWSPRTWEKIFLERSSIFFRSLDYVKAGEGREHPLFEPILLFIARHLYLLTDWIFISKRIRNVQFFKRLT